MQNYRHFLEAFCTVFGPFSGIFGEFGAFYRFLAIQLAWAKNRYAKSRAFTIRLSNTRGGMNINRSHVGII